MTKQTQTTNTLHIKTGFKALTKKDIYMRMLTRIGCTCFLGSLVACDPVSEETEDHDWIVADNQDFVVPADFINPVIAEIDTEIAGKIEFLDESLVGGLGIGVVAFGAEGGRALALLDAEEASPLEVFLALAPADATPPEALIADHQELAGAGEVESEPRALLSLRGETYFNTFCQGGPDHFDDFNIFWNSWSSGYGATNKTGKVTATNVSITTGNSHKRALTACLDGASWGSAYMVIHRLSSELLTWQTVYYNMAYAGEGVAYRSSTLQESTQYRELVSTNAPKPFFVAASW